MFKFLLTENDLRGLVRKLLFEIQDALDTDFYADYGEFSSSGIDLNDKIEDIIKANDDFFKKKEFKFSEGTSDKPNPRIVLFDDNLVIAVDGNNSFPISSSKRIVGIKIHHSKKDKYEKMEFDPSIENIEKILLDYDNKPINEFKKDVLLKDKSNILYCFNTINNLYKFISASRNDIEIKDNQTKRKASDFIDEILECLTKLIELLVLEYKNNQKEDDT